jgi:hypothetical protein
VKGREGTLTATKTGEVRLRKSLLAASVLCIAALCTNQVKAEVAVSRGVGTQTCAQFASNYQRDPSMMDLYVSWAQGYMAATNVFLEIDTKKVVNVIGLTVEELGQHLRSYCDAHPLSEFEFAVEEIMKALPVAAAPPRASTKSYR